MHDSVVNAYGIWSTVFRSWELAVEIRFPDLTRWITERHDQYGLGDTSQEVRAKSLELAARLDEEPLPLSAFLLTGNQFREAPRGGIYSDASFARVPTLWQLVDANTAEGKAFSCGAPLRNTSRSTFGIPCMH